MIIICVLNFQGCKSIMYGLFSAILIELLSNSAIYDNYERRLNIFLLTILTMNISFIIIIGCYKANISISLFRYSLGFIFYILYSIFLFD